MKKSDDEIIVDIYIDYEKRKALKRVKLKILFPLENRKKKWYQFWKKSIKYERPTSRNL
jgi:hypothetical protein